MNKHYKQKSTKSRFTRLAVFLLLFFSGLNLGWSQMSGNYTINSTNAAAGTNYQTWAAFASALSTNGVNGPVSVRVESSLTVTSAVTFNAISGVSSTNRITIEGNNQTLTSSGSNEAILFNGADWITIKSLTISLSSTVTSAIGIRFTNQSDDNTIDGVTIQYTARTATSTSAGAYIAFASSNTSLTTTSTTNNGIRNTVTACTMRTTNSGNPGPAYAIVNQQSTSAYISAATNNSFTNNVISNFFFTAVYNRYTNGDQYISNDISRTNAGSSTPCNLTMVGINSWYTYSTNRSTTYRNNNFHSLPYSGASASSTTNYLNIWNGFSAYYNYGNSTNPFIIDANKFNNIRCYTSTRSDLYYNDMVNFINNEFENIETSITGASYLIYIFYGRDYHIINNRVVNCNFNSQQGAGNNWMYYIYYVGNSLRNRNVFDRNVIDNNKGGNTFYATQFWFYGAWTISRNRITRNVTGYNTRGSFFGLYTYYLYNTDIYSNIVADNSGYFAIYNLYSYNFLTNYEMNIRQNTIRSRNSGYQFHFTYGCYLYEARSFVRFDGNIVDLEDNYYAYPIYLLNQTNGIRSVDNNTFNLKLVNQLWYLGTSTYNTYNAFVTSGIPGPGNNFSDPNFVNPTNLDYRSRAWETQNNVPTVTWAPVDINGKTRNAGFSDRGAVEDSMDVAVVKVDYTLANQVCAGHESNASIWVKNTYIDTIRRFNVAYSVNGGTPVRQFVTNSILPGDSLKIDISSKIIFPIAGNADVNIYLDVTDDNLKNNGNQYFTFVKPAPGGGRFVFSNKITSPNTAFYQLGRPFDITVINTPVIYTVAAPRVYNNSTYGTSSPANWYASAQAYTASGKPVSGASVTAPSGVNNLEVEFQTSDANLEDSLLTLVLKVSDLNNGCDTFIRRNVLIFPSANPDFKFPSKICDGSDVLFENLSDIKPSAALEYFWNFGTGVAADTSNAPEPVFVFPRAGKYSVKMTAKTMPYGFVFTKTKDVEVFDVPSVEFTKSNACLGKDITFESKTTPTSAILEWDFGNNVKRSGAKVAYQYPKAGVYQVKLTADLNGCKSEQVQRVYQFGTPNAGFVLNKGLCDNDEFRFVNTSVYSGGVMGFSWDFSDNGSVSTDTDPRYKFSGPGKKVVTLKSVTEFGCSDTQTRIVEVRESPKVSFTHTPACSITPTEFVNTTNNVTGTVANYNWNMGDGTVKTSKDYTHTWSSLGPKTVTLTVKLNNGCENKISKELNVLTQPKAAFAAADVCAGDPVIFVNNTTWPDGKISYVWDFGDGTFSGSSDPSKNYNVKQTTTYNVTLVASILGGCADSITQRVIINEAPRTCDFTVEPDYAFSFHGIKVNPLNISGAPGGQANVNYTWVFAGVGTEYSANTNAAVSKDMGSDGEYTITMRAVVAQTGCECSMTKKFVLNRAGMEELAKVGVTVYPNPTAGDIKVMVSETFGTGVVRVKSMSGAELKVMNLNGNLLEVNAGDLSNGVYLVEVSNGKQVVTKKITLQK